MLKLKLTYGDDHRRLAISEDVTFLSLQIQVAGVYGLSNGNLTLKYTDTDNDLITVTNDTELDEAKQQALEYNGTLRLSVIDNSDGESNEYQDEIVKALQAQEEEEASLAAIYAEEMSIRDEALAEARQRAEELALEAAQRAQEAEDAIAQAEGKETEAAVLTDTAAKAQEEAQRAQAKANALRAETDRLLAEAQMADDERVALALQDD
eukprot:TRINITY_DN143_c0_g1_i2.p2 TRINITY_DN143_c0_g1~~TRINITY_DN143_c0_g1_i2.p2  ORF type:complete len:209 (-),score=93.03 TRINITY_DN143_c0_g1_i2:72-698(-)